MNRVFLLLIAFFTTSLLNSCPFASGHYKSEKKAPVIVVQPKTLHRPKKIEAKEIALNSFLKQYQKAGFCVHADIQSLSQKASSPGAKALKKALKILADSSKSKSKVHYAAFVTHLREAVRCLEKDASLASYQKQIDLLVNEQYELDLNPTPVGFPYFKQEVIAAAQPKKAQEFSIAQFNPHAIAGFGMTSFSKYLNTLKRKASFRFLGKWDSSHQSIKSKVAQFSFKGQSVDVLRLGMPMISKYYQLSLDPIFARYIELKKQHKQKHLYINLLNQNSNNWERKASKILSDFRKENKEHFFLLSLPHNSAMYKQLNYGEESYLSFSKKLIYSISNQENGFEVPQKVLQKTSYAKDVNQIALFIHEQFFGSKEFLMQQERKQFMDLFYAYFTSYCIENLNVDSVNWTCKLGIDRAMSALSIFLSSIQDENNLQLDELLYVHYWPALLNYYRTPFVSRTTRALDAMQMIETSEKLKPSCISLKGSFSL